MGDRGVLQDPKTAPQGKNFYRNFRECPSHSDLDSLDCPVAPEIPSSPFKGELVFIKLGHYAAIKPLYIQGSHRMDP